MKFERIPSTLFGLILLGLLLITAVSLPAQVRAEENPDPVIVDVEPLDPPREWRILEDDIMVTEKWYARQKDDKTCWSGSFWPGDVIPYTIFANTQPWEDSVILSAIDTWERVCDIDFVPRTSQEDYIRIIKDPEANSSFVGPQGGRQDVKINDFFRIIVCHELFHAMGFFHEQSRPDRVNYVQINWDNIRDDMDHNFEIHPVSGRWTGRYDFNSIMHYGSCDFAKAGCTPGCCTTITVIPPYHDEYQTVIGNRTELSHMDSLTAKFIFSDHSDWSFTAVRMAADYGTFANPYTSWWNAFSWMPVGDTLWMLEGEHFDASGVFSKETLIHNTLEPVTVGPDTTSGIWFEVNSQIKMYPGGAIEVF